MTQVPRAKADKPAACFGLAVQGLLADAGKGLVFRKLGQCDLVQIHAVRATLQGLAARNATEAETDAMRMLQGRLTAECASDTQKALRTARRLDQLIYDAAHNEYLSRHIPRKRFAFMIEFCRPKSKANLSLRTNVSMRRKHNLINSLFQSLGFVAVQSLSETVEDLTDIDEPLPEQFQHMFTAAISCHLFVKTCC